LSVTDDIAEEIVRWCMAQSTTEYSYTIISEDWICYCHEFTNEIAVKLRAKGSEVKA